MTSHPGLYLVAGKKKSDVRLSVSGSGQSCSEPYFSITTLRRQHWIFGYLVQNLDIFGSKRRGDGKYNNVGGTDGSQC